MTKALSSLLAVLLILLSHLSATAAEVGRGEGAMNGAEKAECSVHIYSQTETIREPGLVTAGKQVRTCRICGFEEKTEVPPLMQAESYSYSRDGKTIMLPYRIYYPDSPENSGPVPIVLYYHGAGEVGTDNVTQVRRSALVQRLVELDRVIVLAPQCGAGARWVNTTWSEGSYDSTLTDPSIWFDASIALLDEIIGTGKVDENRVYLAGISMGGFAVWKALMDYPGKFAAAVPVCGAGDPERADGLRDVAIWAFHGDRDKVVPVSGSRDMIDAIRKFGGTRVKYTEYQEVGHNCWTYVAEEPELTDWLLSCRKP